MQFIFTCQEKHKKLTQYEFCLYDKTFKFNDWLDDEVGLADTELTSEEMSVLIRKSPIIFIRHIFKVDEIIDIHSDNLTNSILNLCFCKIDIGRSYSIQIKMKNAEIVDLITSELSKCNYILDAKNSEQVVSIYAHNDMIYVGIDDTRNNLSKWKGGMSHYSPTADYNFISRAEYKLLETLECIDIDLSEMKCGLDLGAAPGGWTKVLIDNNIKAVSVDPNNIDTNLQQNDNVKYYPMTAEQYLRIVNDEKFDIILNDMKMDIEKSINIILRLYDRLNDGGIVIMTFKLPYQFSYKHILNNIKSLSRYELIGARQFFHNRSEITVILKKQLE